MGAEPPLPGQGHILPWALLNGHPVVLKAKIRQEMRHGQHGEQLEAFSDRHGGKRALHPRCFIVCGFAMPQTWGSVTGVLLLVALLAARALLKSKNLPPPPWRLAAAAVALQLLVPPIGAVIPSSTRQLVLLLDDLVGAYALLGLLSWGLLEIPPSIGIGRGIPQILRDLLTTAASGVVTVVILQQARVNLVGLVTTSAILTAVIGLAAQETLKDLFGGLSMQIGASYRVGDWVDLGGHRGRVESITLMNTVLSSLDGAELVIPNSQAASASIRRFRPQAPVGNQFTLGLDYGHPPSQAMRLIMDVVRSHPDVMDEPEPRTWIREYGDSAIQYEVLVFQQEAGDGPRCQLKGELLGQLWYALNREGRRIPFPVLELRKHHNAPPEPDAASWEEPEHRAVLLAQNPLFSRLNPSDLATLASLTRCIRYGPGETIVREGEQGDCLYQVISGTLEVHRRAGHASNNEIGVARLGPTDIFGEMTLCTDAPRNATVRAITETTLLEVERSDVKALFDGNPGLLEDLGELVTQRLRELENASNNEEPTHKAWLIAVMRRVFQEMAT